MPQCSVLVLLRQCSTLLQPAPWCVCVDVSLHKLPSHLGHCTICLLLGVLSFLYVELNPSVCSVCGNKSRVLSVSPSRSSNPNCPFLFLFPMSLEWVGGCNSFLLQLLSAAVQKPPLSPPPSAPCFRPGSGRSWCHGFLLV